MQAMIVDCGGLWSAKITTECTHLVATEDQYSRNGVKGMFEQLILLEAPSHANSASTLPFIQI